MTTFDTSDYFDLNGNEFVVGPGGLITVKPGGYIVEPFMDNVTATAGGGQANAIQLTGAINRLSVVATTGDSARLPASVGGWTTKVINSSNNAAQLYGLGTDTINGVANATGYTLAANTTKSFACLTPGAWYTN